MRRILPVIEALSGRLRVPISVDTTKSEVAAAALEAGAEVINDVSGLSFDPRMADVAARHRAGLIISHIQGRPRTMQKDPRYKNLLPEVLGFLRGGVRRALKAGVKPGAILIDPGIGFGKTAEHNVLLLRHLRVLRATGYPVMVGASRKSFLTKLQGGRGPEDRLGGSLGAAAAAIWFGASALRVHDVAATVRMARTVEAVRDVRVDRDEE
jgi:dihydropteroate synthase